ncbi:MAG: DUF1295 domain-containing protein [Anaerolineales bacterium]|nr:DUF1295 domain-containing protein [Anaerolineales bacterium]MDW8276463.1 DUF1295 domain-containing protein [Anaerolineales bacterium]
MFKQKYFIDTHKGITFVVLLAMMAWFGRWESVTAWVYLALHGTYGLLWVLKSRLFPDKQWEEDKGAAYALLIIAGLSAYWVSGLLITWLDVKAPAWLIGLCVSMNVFGVFFHFVSDMQKYVQLKYHPGHLITDGLFARTRNINYFGELLIYLSFALLSMHWLPLVILAGFVFGFWLGQMRKKDQSLARYAEFAAYKKKSKLFIPFLF